MFLENCSYIQCIPNLSILILVLIVICLIFIPLYFAYKHPNQFTLLAQTVFQIGLCLASVYLGFTYNTIDASRSATNKWLPAAETACNDLITIRSAVCRIQNHLNKLCDEMKPIMDIQSTTTDNKKVLETFFRQQCKHCEMNLENLDEQLQNTFELWLRFLDSNCEKEECSRIKNSIGNRQKELGLTSNATCCPGNSSKVMIEGNMDKKEPINN